VRVHDVAIRGFDAQTSLTGLKVWLEKYAVLFACLFERRHR
jgi:hypothetical protein